MVEQIAHGDGETGLTRASHHLNREHAIPAHLEEAVLGPDNIQAKHFGEDAAQRRLCRDSDGGHCAFTRKFSA